MGGGLAPMIATKLLSIGQGNPYLIMLYIGSMAVIAIISTSFMPRDGNPKTDETYYKKTNLNLKPRLIDTRYLFFAISVFLDYKTRLTHVRETRVNL